ncbi:hypothetical protein [Streptomyces fagopyri]
MADDTQTQGTPAIPPTAIGHCAWHDGVTRDVRLIEIHGPESGRLSERKRFACHPCQIQYGLVPRADLP